jgi:hypothetical protein
MNIIARYRLTGFVLLACGSLALSARAQTPVLLWVDVSSPSSVKFTSSTANADTNASSTTEEGVNLEYFFTVNVPTGSSLDQDLTGDLSPSGTTENYNKTYAYEGNRYCQIVENVGNVPQSFTTSTRAFTGEGTADLSSLSAYLPASGSGPITVSDTVSGDRVTIGYWQVVPEPSAWAGVMLAATGLGGILLRRRARPRE